MQLKGPVVLMKEAYAFYKKNFKLLAGIILLSFVVETAVTLMLSGGAYTSSSIAVENPAQFLAVITSMIVGIFATIALILAIDNPEGIGTVQQAYKASAKFFFPYLVVAVLCGVAITVGLILFIIPGVVLAVWFAFSSFTVLFEGKRGVEALKTSKEYVRGLWGAILLRIVAFIVTVLVVMIFFSIFLSGHGIMLEIVLNAINAALTPFVLICVYLLYKDVRKQHAIAEPQA